MAIQANMTSGAGFFQSLYSGIVSEVTAALVILILGIILGRILRGVVSRALKEIEADRMLNKAGIKLSFGSIAGYFAEYLVYFITIIIVLSFLGIERQVVNIIAFALIAIVAASSILAVRDFVPNMFAGFFIMQKKKVMEGDTLTYKDVTGKVIEVGLIEVKVITKQGDLLYIPNALINKKSITIKRPKQKKEQ